MTSWMSTISSKGQEDLSKLKGGLRKLVGDNTAYCSLRDGQINSFIQLSSRKSTDLKVLTQAKTQEALPHGLRVFQSVAP